MGDDRPDREKDALIAQLRAENAALRARVGEREAWPNETSGLLDLSVLSALLAEGRPEAIVSEIIPAGKEPPWIALMQSWIILQSLLQNSPSVIFVKDMEGRYVVVNDRLTELFQVPADWFLGKTDLALFPPEIAAQLRAHDQATLAAGSPQHYEERVQSANGPRDFQSVKFPLRGPGGQHLGICGIAMDITERKRAEADRVALQEQVIEAQRAALRELSTPLVPIAEGVLAMPLIGTIDSVRAGEIMETLLEGISRERACMAILDITGVKVVDTQVANALIQAARAAKLLGTEVLLTGVSPAIAQTLVTLELDLHDLTTLATLQSGIAYALSAAPSRRPRSRPRGA